MTNYTVTSGNPSIGLTLNNGDELQVETTAVAEYTTVNSGASVNVLSGGLLLDAATNGGVVNVYAGGTAAGTEVTGGGFQYDYGTDFQTTVTNGTEYVLSAVSLPPVSEVSGKISKTPSLPAGIASSTTLDSDGVQYVQYGGSATSTTVNSGGQQYVQFGGTANATEVNSGGVQYVQSGGNAQATALNNGGVEQVQSGGTAIGTLILAGGNELVSAGGTASGATIFSGGDLTVEAGASVTGGLTVSGGAAFIVGSVAAGEAVGFAGTGGNLELDNLAGFAGSVSGFAAGDQIDLVNFAPGGSLGILGSLFGGTPQWAFAESASHASGTLTVIDGSQQAQLTLLGNYSAGNFAVSNDGAGGLLIRHT